MIEAVCRYFESSRIALILCACLACPAAQAAVYTVGPVAVGACGGSDCDYQSIQAAINAAAASDTITVYRRTDDATNNYCYDEHIVINKANLIVQGSSTTPANIACIGTTNVGDIVTITASGVTFKNFEVSGKSNNGAGGLNSKNTGGRHAGAGIRIFGDDIDDVVIENCTVTFTMEENIRWQGDRDGDNNGNVTIRNCYLHHSDLPKANIRIDGGSSPTDVHLVEDNLLTTGQGIYSDAEYITVRENIVEGWPYWAHMVNNGTWPETHDYSAQSANYGGGWRYFSRCEAGVWVANGGAGTDIQILNNLIIGTRRGIRVQTTGTITNNTVVNPFYLHPDYGYNSSIDATKVRDNTYGIMLVSGFSGTLQNNIVVVTEDNRATGQPGKATTPYYTPGITGYGIGFSGGSGSLGVGASVRNNDVWGFVDTDGSTATNWGSGLSTCGDNSDSKCSDNVSEDPLFATDTSDETNDGGGGCDADIANSRCYELYYDNFFLSTTGTNGSCHADIRANTASYVGFVDLTSSSGLAGLGDCVAAVDLSASGLIDAGTGAVSNEPSNNGGLPNLGAFGNTGRGSVSTTLKIVAITAGSGSVKNGTEGYSGPGVIQPRSGGLTQINIDFNRAVTATSSSFQVRTGCDLGDLTAPTYDFSGATTSPFRVTLTWPASTFDDQWVRIHVFGDGVNRIVDLFGEALDGEISDLRDGTLPSGNGTAGGDAQFLIGVLYGDVDGDQLVEGANGEDDRLAIEGYPGYAGATCSACPHDVDGDGDVDVQDRNAVGGQDNDSLATTGACIVVSGIAYLSDGTTPITGKVLTVAARINGAGTYTTDSNSVDGTWKFPGIVVAPGDAIALFLDTEVEEANLATTTNGINNITGVSMLESFLVIRSDDGANGTTITDVAYFDNDDDALEMLFTANGGSLVMESGMGLKVETGGIFAPGGAVDVDTGGIQIAGTWNATGSEAISVEGDWTLTGTFSAASSTVTIDGAAGGTSTITGTNTFYNLTCTTDNRTLTFPASTTTTVSNILTLEGASGKNLLVRSSSPATAFTLSVGGSFQDNAGNSYMDYIDVQDCTAAGSAAWFLAFDAVNSGNNTSWYFNTIFVDTIADTSDNVTTTIKALYNDAAVPNGDGAVSLREALTAVAASETLKFDTTVFPSGTPATIDVDTSALPALSASSVTLDASDAGVIIDDTDSDLADGDHGLSITGSSNTIYGLQIQNFDAGTGSYGINITGSTNTIGGTGAGQALTVTGNGGAGINVATSTVDNTFRGNLVYNNTGIAVDLIGTANNSITAPTIDSAVYTCSSQAEISGSGAAASATIDVYSNDDGDTDCLNYEGSTTADGSGNFAYTDSSFAGSYAVAIQTDASGDSSEVSSAEQVLYIAQYCYDTYATGWATTPGNMTDCSTSTYGESGTDAELQELTAHTIELGCGSGTITKVEVRYWGSRHNGPGNGSNNRASVTPVFGGTTDGDVHDPGTVLTGGSVPISWIDITSDTNAPGSWAWSDVTNLDLDINSIVAAGKLRVYKVELRVTYTP